eukprot:2140226-Amphidinium_carterae.1
MRDKQLQVIGESEQTDEMNHSPNPVAMSAYEGKFRFETAVVVAAALLSQGPYHPTSTPQVPRTALKDV